MHARRTSGQIAGRGLWRTPRRLCSCLPSPATPADASAHGFHGHACSAASVTQPSHLQYTTIAQMVCTSTLAWGAHARLDPCPAGRRIGQAPQVKLAQQPVLRCARVSPRNQQQAGLLLACMRGGEHLRSGRTLTCARERARRRGHWFHQQRSPCVALRGSPGAAELLMLKRVQTLGG